MYRPFNDTVQHHRQSMHRILVTLMVLLLVFGGIAFSAAPAQAANCRANYTVASGETLFRIGLRYNLTWDRIAEANNIQDGNKIFTGQVLCIPAASLSGGLQFPTAGDIPTISIRAVVKDQTVTIIAANFPAKTQFDVHMGLIGTQGLGGTDVMTLDSGLGGTFSQTFTIPANLRGQGRIAIRLENVWGYYSYNWFWNNSTP